MDTPIDLINEEDYGITDENFCRYVCLHHGIRIRTTDREYQVFKNNLWEDFKLSMIEG